MLSPGGSVGCAKDIGWGRDITQGLWTEWTEWTAWAAWTEWPRSSSLVPPFSPIPFQGEWFAVLPL
jgi:hypothetical protein